MTKRIVSPDLTLQHFYSNDKDLSFKCSCCVGPHIYTSVAREDGAVGSFSSGGFVFSQMRGMRDGQRFRVVVELINDAPQPPDPDADISSERHGEDETAVCNFCGWEGSALRMRDSDLCPSCRQDALNFFTKPCTCRQTMGERCDLHRH